MGAGLALFAAVSTLAPLAAAQSMPIVSQHWSVTKTSWPGSCNGLPAWYTTRDWGDCQTMLAIGWSGNCGTGDTDPDHYVATSSFPGSVPVYHLRQLNACGCKDAYVLTTDASWRTQLVASGWNHYWTFYAWPATSAQQVQGMHDDWGLVPIYHGYRANACDNYYTEHGYKMAPKYQSQGYTFGPASEPKVAMGGYGPFSVAYVAADGWVRLAVQCNGAPSCSWSVQGPGGWSFSGDGAWSSIDKLPSHKYRLTCDAVPGMVTANPYTVYNLSYFQSHTLTCSYSCSHQCTSGQRTCDGNGYRVCQTNSAGCRVWSSTTSCSDGVACTVDSCSGGFCQNSPQHAQCNDGNPCTSDSCTPSGCVYNGAPMNGAACNDGDPCTLGDACLFGSCQPSAALACDDANACTDDACVGGSCQFTPNAAPCDDGDPCTTGDTCSGGSCAGAAIACDDANPCTVSACVGGACEHAPLDGVPCDSGGACATAECVAGACVQTSVDCDDADPCTADACVAGACEHTPLSGVPCDDGDACTTGDTCDAGACVGAALICDDANPCTDSACVAGACEHTPNAAPCDDGDACTTGDLCAFGVCTGAAITCDDGDPCTVSSCDPDQGCVHAPLSGTACSDGDACTTGDACADGVCVPGPAMACDDGDACTVDACSSETGACVYTPIPGCCSADDDCALAGGCAQSRCLAGACHVIPECVAGSVCVFGGCYRACDPPKDRTQCGESADVLYECLTDPVSQHSVWLPRACDDGTLCALNADTLDHHCCEPNCAGRECGRPSSCMIPCGVCDPGFTCAGPNEPYAVSALDPDAFRCVPGCAQAGAALPDEEQTWHALSPECGPALAGTVATTTCPACDGRTACYGGSCRDQCQLAGVTAVGRCSGTVAAWCEDGAPRELDCATEGSACCPAGTPGNPSGQVGCCSCATECEVKGWECGANSCGDPCGDPERDDGCPDGYDCQGRRCVCTIPSRCGPEDVVEAAEAEVVEAVERDEGARVEHEAEGGCEGCGASPDSPTSSLLMLLTWLVLSRPRPRRRAPEDAC